MDKSANIFKYLGGVEFFADPCLQELYFSRHLTNQFKIDIVSPAWLKYRKNDESKSWIWKYSSERPKAKTNTMPY